MNILITRFPYESSWGGEEHHTMELAIHCRDNGHDVSFAGSCKILLKKFEEESFPTRKITAPKMPVTPLSLLRFLLLYPLVSFYLYLKFSRIFAEEKIEVIYCLSLVDKIILTPIAHERNIKVIWVEHQQIRNWLIKSPLKYLYRRRSKLASIIPISEWNKKKLLSEIKVDPKNIKAILNGVDHSELLSYRSNTKKKNLIGFASRLIKKKGAHILISAFHQLHKKDNSLELIIIGDGPEKKNLEQLVSRLKIKKQITFLGHLNTRKEYLENMSQFSTFILPSIDESETFGLVAAEAMSLGAVTVVTEACGISHYLKDGYDSFIAKANNVESLLEKISEAVQDKGKISHQGQKTSQEKFDEDKCFDQFLKLFES